MKLREFTLKDGRPAWINLDLVASLFEHDGCTRVFLVGDDDFFEVAGPAKAVARAMQEEPK